MHKSLFEKYFIILLLAIALGRGGLAAPPANEWPARVPSFAQSTEQWSQLVDSMTEHGMYYGALAASYRMLMFFNDLPVKEQAYKTIIRIIDLGYAFPTLDYFVTGDIEPKEDYDFSNSYYFYKALAAKERGVGKWADSYLVLVDTENFSKYLFYQALEAYSRGDLAKAEQLLLRVLSKKPRQRYFALTKKAARTLARIYFEQQRYLNSYDIYRSFLLHLNPIDPNDWLEAAWNLYYLKHYDEALGMVFNLESLAGGEMVNPEKYVLRALIYEELCATDYMQKLVSSFENEFGQAITGIKTGKILSRIPALTRIYIPENQAFYRINTTLINLREEVGQVGHLPGDLHDLARYLYATEISVLQKRYPAYSEQASERAANHLINFAESLRFIKFDVAQSRLGPDLDLNSAKPGDGKKKKDDLFDIHWTQTGDFWRDERLRYHAVIENRCNQ